MSYVDRSGTNWMPWKPLRGASPRVVVTGGVVAIMTAAYGMLKLRQSYAGMFFCPFLFRLCANHHH